MVRPSVLKTIDDNMDVPLKGDILRIGISEAVLFYPKDNVRVYVNYVFRDISFIIVKDILGTEKILPAIIFITAKIDLPDHEANSKRTLIDNVNSY